MKKTLLALLLVLPVLDCHSQPKTPADYVCGMMGTDAEGRIVPIAAKPFGMVEMGPDSWYIASGYHYTHSKILSFSHTRANGIGGGDTQDICVMPLSGSGWENPDEYPDDIQCAFSHEREYVEPGYYTVDLLDYGIKAELTATERCGIHRYTYPRGRRYFSIDMKRGNNCSCTIYEDEFHDTVTVSSIEIVDEYTVRGYRVTTGWSPEQHCCFYARFSKPFDRAGLYSYRKPVDSRSVVSRDVRTILSFPDDGEPLEVYVGISPVSVDGARMNYEVEAKGKNFEQLRLEARNAWNRELSAFRVSDENPELKKVFYTSAYYALLFPQLYCDVDGRYRGGDFKVHKADFKYFGGCLGLWDTHRAQLPLICILHPEVMSELMRTMQKHFDQCGQLPIYTINAQETCCMTGYHSMPVIAATYSRGIRGFDADSLLTAMRTSACRDTFGFFCKQYRGATNYLKYHYVPCDLEMHATSKTLEYCYDDWCIAQMARLTGHKDVYREYMERSSWYRNVFDKSVGFTCGRNSDGSWRPDFNPFYTGWYTDDTDYLEANSWQYSFFVPQDPEGLILLGGGRGAFAGKLDTFFTATAEGEAPEVFGRFGQYAHTNEPVHHVIFLYNYAGQPWKCQELVSKVLYTQYNTTPGGMCGNDDTGQMSAWFVMNAMGFYPFNHGQDMYEIGSPLFRRLSMKHACGTLTIIADNVSRENCYIQSMKINGRQWRSCRVSGSQLLDGDVTVEYVMGPEPNVRWGR